MTTYSILSFQFFINGNQILKGDYYGFRDSAILTFLYTAISLEPLNLFLYTWRFLETLEKEESVKSLKKCYRYFAIVSVCLIPVSFYSVLIADAVFEGLNED